MKRSFVLAVLSVLSVVAIVPIASATTKPKPVKPHLTIHVGKATFSSAGVPVAYKPYLSVQQFGSFGTTAGYDDCVFAAAADIVQLRYHTKITNAAIEAIYNTDTLTPYGNEPGVSPNQIVSDLDSTTISGHSLTASPISMDQQTIESSIVNGGVEAEIDIPFGPPADAGMGLPFIQNASPFNRSTHTHEIPWSTDNSVPPAPYNGLHAVALVGYGPTYLYLVSWGSVFPVTWSWWATYGYAAWTIS